MDDYTIEHAIKSLLVLAYNIMDYYKFPEGVDFIIESEIYGKKIHVMLEAVNDDD